MNILDRIIGLYAPHLCLGCGSEGALLCHECRGSLRQAEAMCYRCQSPSYLGRSCSDCRSRGGLVSVNCAAAYSGLAKDLLWSLKFERAQSAAGIIADILAEEFALNTKPDVLLVPLPTAAQRVRKRGYDQSVLIARAYARRTGCKYAPLLRRYGSQEQKGADRQQRLQQLDGSLAEKYSEAVVGKRIIIIDDVVTTGASMEAAAVALRAAGAKVVAGLAFVRA